MKKYHCDKSKRLPIKLTLDAAFKAFFKQREDLLISLLQDFLPLPKNSTVESVQV